MNNPLAKEYLSLLNGTSPAFVSLQMLDCNCIVNNVQPNDAHSENATPVSSNLAELAANQGANNVRSVVMYLSKTSYFNSNTMKFLINKMLECTKIGIIESYYSTINSNFNMHPPCAFYMKTEYKQLLLTPHGRYFNKMTLWDFLVENFELITSGSFLNGENKAHDLAFKRCLDFCIKVLMVDFEASKTDNCKPLIMNCLEYNPKRRTRMSKITKLLDTLINTRNDLQMPIFNLAYLIEQITK